MSLAWEGQSLKFQNTWAFFFLIPWLLCSFLFFSNYTFYISCCSHFLFFIVDLHKSDY